MKIKVTGDFRDVADSAWISTLSEARAKARNDEDALRVVKFLIDHKHTSPLESVSITLSGGGIPGVYAYNKYARTAGIACTIDLLNFLKVTVMNDMFDQEPWQLFTEARPELSKLCIGFTPLEAIEFPDDVSDVIGDHNMEVELISFHDAGPRALNRATWRIKCPLSISVQILRHRTGSFNQVSGRYKTIFQEIVPPVDDCNELFKSIGYDLNRFLGSVDGTIIQYKRLMRDAKKSKNDGIITNDEYKRIREFARFVLPEGRMTELYATFYLTDFYDNFLVLRNSEHAQTEHIWIAQQMKKVLEEPSDVDEQ